MIYYVRTPQRILLVTLYSKTEQGDIAPEAIRQIIESYEADQAQKAT